MKYKNYISEGGRKKLLDEVNALTKERTEVVKLVQWAASNGDRSENADYLYGKKRLREIDSRLKFLRRRLEHAHVVRPQDQNIDKGGASKALFGSKVIVKDESEKIKEYILVGVDEVNITLGHISIESPIGRNLLGKVVGDCVEILTPKGALSLEILSIEFTDWNKDI